MSDNIIIDLLIAQLIKTAIIFIVWYLSGLLVLKKNVKVNYTRKINHFTLLIIPYLMDMILKRTEDADTGSNSEGDIILSAIGLLLGLSYFLLFLKPIRDRSKIIHTAFLSIDRPEDRPNTLLWISTQSIANYFVAIPFTSYLISINKMELVFIIMIINGVGDGLAEPVGIRFGKHKYKTYALFSKKKYERSVEGSACVFITSLITIIVFGPLFSPIQFIVALIAIPILMTLAEAFSPHSWDNPFLALVGEILLFLILSFL